MKKHWLRRGSLVLLGMLLLAALASPGPARAQGEEQAFLGVRVQSTADGALIAEVIPGSGADDAGLQAGDLITAVDGEPVNRDHDLQEYILAHQPGDTVTLTVERGGEAITVEATLGVRPDDLEEPPSGEPSTARPTVTRHYVFAGGTFALTDQGWEVRDVADGSRADQAGLQVGDLVRTLNGQPVTDLRLGRVAAVLAAGGDIVLGVSRDGETLDITLHLRPGTPIQSYEVREAPSAPPPVTVEPVQPPVVVPPVTGEMLTGRRGFLGVSFVTLTAENIEELAAELETTIPVEQGALVMDVMADTPADDIGLAVGDVITAVNDEPVDEEHTLADRLYAYEVGDTVTLTVARADETLTLEATLIARPPEARPQAIPMPFAIGPDACRDFLREHPDLLPEFWERMRQYMADGDPEPLREFLEAHGLEGVVPLPRRPEGEEGRGAFGFFFTIPGRGRDFAGPGFDWERFLEQHPALGEWLGRFGRRFDPEALPETFPGLRWFGGEADSSPQRVTPAPAQPGTSA